MLGQIFHVDVAEVAQSGVHGNEGEINTFDFHTFHKLTAEVETGCRHGNGSFIFGVDSLETFFVFRFCRAMDERRQWRFSQGIQSLLEFIMRTVV